MILLISIVGYVLLSIITVIWLFWSDFLYEAVDSDAYLFVLAMAVLLPWLVLPVSVMAYASYTFDISDLVEKAHKKRVGKKDD